ncbi:50S ribosomal protein L29 [Infirmifilum sp. NZ]|uniref:50S ribosomal protein L29 n=1 Tax=Infirmifilum sp. NZ TaxID=2926850 RepID=UPI0027A6820A|nr:50S ribosomal protein L29 [Infirmifilum sp. NZ]UNQ72555.1 50S ribosomal protein L29 [Infirmifilum sp. NZ]
MPKGLMSIDEIRGMSPEDRRKKLAELRAELARLKAQAMRGSLEKPALIRKTKRTIAMILTVEREEARKKQ